MSFRFLRRRPAAARRAALGLALGLLAVLASCGGGGLVEPFRPTRILALGDELSVIEADGRKYGINAFKITDATTTPPTESTTELDCARNPIWIQSVAAGFGLAFDRCLGAATAATGQVLAQAGSKVADLATQLAAMTGDPLGEKDIAVVLVGMHDILDAYAVYAADPTTPKSVVLDQVRAAGTDLGNRINALATSGPAVVVLTVPDLGLTPFARAENTSSGDATRAALLSELTSAFNNRMSVTLINDGRLIGLVFADIEIQNEVKFPSSFGLANVIDAACDVNVPLPGCTTATLATGATAAGYMWADSLRPGPTVQARLGALAESRARNNPF
ncbi:MAG: hypothetical protein OEU94_00925 [Aquincola sp.]|nr:hypothetical protein [Aquincola sp.]MDH4290266.1 hypothetical protein [Aquincola sp.]MDH5328515.1 hypothetical protein [Aquincola sp.]